MYEYTIEHIHAKTITHIYGYTFADACRRNNKDSKLWNVLDVEYVD